MGDSSELSVVAPQVVAITFEKVVNDEVVQTFTFFSDHDGDNENDHQLATVPVTRGNTISITFSRAIDTSGVSASSLTIVDDPDNPTTTKTPTGISWSADGTTATWTLSSGLGTGEWYFVLDDADFTTTTGMQLDGDWDNPAYYDSNYEEVTDFHSGDGSPGGDFIFAFTVLPGDANRDCKVDGSDATILATYWQYSNATWEMGDFNWDEFVDGSDATILATYWNISYWQPPAMMGMGNSAFSSSNSLAMIDTIFEKYGFTTETEEDDAVYGTDEWDSFIDELLGIFA